MSDTALINEKYILAFWMSSNNVGDNMNHYLLNKISGKIPVFASDRKKPHYICCGSILGEYETGSSICGAGFFYEHQILNYEIPIHSVRGELTRAQVKSDCIVGDPALLLPLFYKPKIEKKHKIGIIPHWSNMQDVLEMNYNAHIIDPMQSVEDFVDDIVSCENIFSESLHGLIVSDTYEVPNKWVNFGGDSGGGFKYRDYYSSTYFSGEQPSTKPYLPETKIHTYKNNLQSLLNSFPFYNGLN